MPIKQAAKKALRQSAKRQKSNLAYHDKTKNLIKKVRNLVNQKKTKEAKSLLAEAYQALDKAAKAGVIKKNAAARKKSRLTNLVNKA